MELYIFHKFPICQSHKHLVDLVTPWQFNIDTKNDGLEDVSPASRMVSFWISMLIYVVVSNISYISPLLGEASNFDEHIFQRG